MHRLILSTIFAMSATLANALDRDAPFDSIDGGTLALSDWAGQPILVVNTASLCGFSGQFRDLQALYDAYKDQGLVVLAVPSNDFRQELASNEEVHEYCELQYGIDLPMTTITNVTGPDAHPVFASLREDYDFTPDWNFNKVLIGPEGDVIETYPSSARPMSRRVTDEIEKLLVEEARS